MRRENQLYTPIGLQLIRNLAEKGVRIFSIQEARAEGRSIGLSGDYLRQVLFFLTRAGWIVRLKRGLYSLSTSVPGVTPAHEFEVALALVQPSAISHWSAFHHYGFTDQIPRHIFVSTTRRNLPRFRAQRTTYRFHQVKPERFFGLHQVWIGDARITMTDPERTLLDGLDKPQYFGDMAEVLHGFQQGLPRININRLISHALKLDDATAKRLGWVLENNGVGLARLQRLLQRRMKGYRPLDPTRPRQGPCHSRWQIQGNLSTRRTS